MKNLFLTFSVIIAFVLQSCDNKDDNIIIIDYGCETVYQVENKSDNLLEVVIVYGNLINKDDKDELSETVSIAPGEKKTVYIDVDMCGENTMITEVDGDKLPIQLYGRTMEAIADGKKINENFFDKVNWKFSAVEYYKATYLLVVTEELIEKTGYKQQ